MSYILQWLVVAVVVIASAVFLARRLGRDECACPYAGKCKKCACNPEAMKECGERMKQCLEQDTDK